MDESDKKTRKCNVAQAFTSNILASRLKTKHNYKFPGNATFTNLVKALNDNHQLIQTRAVQLRSMGDKQISFSSKVKSIMKITYNETFCRLVVCSLSINLKS